ncbi:MAG: PIN domain-containing protein [Acidimicrobiia bacterium]|nr:PIN domain-containing protein [Acidimicrobiia bacterium]
MALTHLVDTSVVSRLRNADVRAVIDSLASTGRVGRAGITDLEVGYSSRNAREWDQDIDDLAVFELIETTANHMRRARQTQRLLASRSQRGRKIPDLLVAAAAEEAGLTLLHYDADFDLIAKVTGQHCQWVVAAGTVD